MLMEACELQSNQDSSVCTEDTFEIESLLGQGSFANIYLARRTSCHENHENGSERVTLKVLTKGVDSSADELRLLNKEHDSMAAVQCHPNIVACYGLTLIEKGIDDDIVRLPCWAMEMEYCNEGDLHDFVSNRRLEENEALHVMQGICHGLAHIHKHDYCHRDIKPENVLFNGGVAKLADFGLCCHTSNEQEMIRRCGSIGYIAPEVILGQTYGPKVDCFSAGALLYFIVSGKLAFSGPDAAKAMKRTLTSPLNFRKSMRLECLSESCKDFMVEMTSKDPLLRPTSKDALQSPWFLQGESQYPSEANQISSNADLTVHVFSGDEIDSNPMLEHESRLAEDMVAYPQKPCKATFERLSDASTTCPETTGRERETFTSVDREADREAVDDGDDLLLKTPYEPMRPGGRPRSKSRIPYFLRARRGLFATVPKVSTPH